MTWSEIRTVWAERVAICICIVADAVLVSFAGAVNFGASKVVQALDLEGVDAVVFIALQIVLGVGTVGSTVLMVYRDFVRALKNGGQA